MPPCYAELIQPDFEKLAIGFGAKGLRLERPDDLAKIDRALAVEEGPVIVNVRINRDVEFPVSWEKVLEMTGLIALLQLIEDATATITIGALPHARTEKHGFIRSPVRVRD